MKQFKSENRSDTLESQKGFTLIELSIVLVIIGLLIGGVIKGQELVRGAKVGNAWNGMQGFIAAANNYSGTYRAWPGDDNRANARWGATDGNGDGQIGGSFRAATNGLESRVFWEHLRSAQLVAGAGAGVAEAQNQPNNPFGGIYGVQNGALGQAGPQICMNAVPGDLAQRMDEQYDDGLPGTGTIAGGLDANATNRVAAGTGYVAANLYVICHPMI